MSRPFRAKSHDAVTSAGPGESHDTKGHNSLGLFVVARNLDDTNDEVDVQVETSPTDDDDTEWTPITTMQGGSQVTQLTLDVEGYEDEAADGTFVGYIYAHGIPCEYVRANITTLTDAADDDLEVDTYIMGANNGGTGHAYDHIE